MRFANYVDGKIIEDNLCKEFVKDDVKMFGEIKKIKELYENYENIFSDWKIALRFYEKNTKGLLKSSENKSKFIKYQLKIILNAGMELCDKLEKLYNNYYHEQKDECKFKKMISDIYDKNFTYRLIYNLRNYAQHVNMFGVDILNINGKNELVLNLDVFINNHKKLQKKVREELTVLKQKLNYIRINEEIKRFDTIVDLIKNNSQDYFKELLFRDRSFYRLSLTYLYYKYGNLEELNNVIIEDVSDDYNNGFIIHNAEMFYILRSVGCSYFLNIKTHKEFSKFLERVWEFGRIDTNYDILKETDKYLLKTTNIMFKNEDELTIQAIERFIELFKF